MTTLAINKLWSFLQSLSMTASDERWLAERWGSENDNNYLSYKPIIT